MSSFWIVLLSIALVIGGFVRIKYSKHIKDHSENRSTYTQEEQGSLQQGVNYLTGATLIVMGTLMFFFGILGGTF